MPEVAEPRVPSSFAPVKQVAPAAVLVVALCIFFATLRGAANDWWVGPCVFAIPVVTIAVALMGGGDRPRFWRVLLVGLVLEAGAGILLMFMLGPSVWLALLAVVCALLCFGLVGFAMLPIMMAVRAYGSRTDLEAGDAMLAAGGAWLVAIQTFAILIAPSELPWIVPGLAIGMFAIAVSVDRTRSRRRWCARAADGHVEGIRLRRASVSLAELELPTIHGSTPTMIAVVEKLIVGRTAYRSSVIGEAIATIRVPLAMRDRLPVAGELHALK